MERAGRLGAYQHASDNDCQQSARSPTERSTIAQPDHNLLTLWVSGGTLSRRAETSTLYFCMQDVKFETFQTFGDREETTPSRRQYCNNF